MQPLTSIERDYEYRARWTTIFFCALFFGVCAAVLGNVAVTNDRGLVINGIITLSPQGATIFYGVLCVLSIGFVVLAAFLAYHRLTQRQRIAITPDAIFLPASHWSSAETGIPYDEIIGVKTAEFNGERFVYVYRDNGLRYTITGSLLPSKAATDEILELLQQRTARTDSDD